MSKKIIVLTGAAGNIGRRTRSFLQGKCALRSTDILSLGQAAQGEEVVICDLSNEAETLALMKGASAVVHLAGIPRDASIQDIAAANIVATWNVYQAALQAGVQRVIFGSTNHVVGFYNPEDRIGVDAAARPDTLYGSSKVFGEAVARLHWDKYAIESVCLRIGSALEKPLVPRHLSTWVSYDDLNHLIWSALKAERVGYSVAYGVSDNKRAWWNNEGASHLGYQPQDKAEDFAEEILEKNELLSANPHAAETRFQGGPWAAAGFTADFVKVKA